MAFDNQSVFDKCRHDYLFVHKNLYDTNIANDNQIVFLKNADHELFYFIFFITNLFNKFESDLFNKTKQKKKNKIRDTFGNQNTTDSSTFHKQPISSIL